MKSSPVELAGEAIGRISARRLSDGRIEYAFTPTGRERILPYRRYFPANPDLIGNWKRSSEIMFLPAPAAPAAQRLAHAAAAQVPTRPATN